MKNIIRSFFSLSLISLLLWNFCAAPIAAQANQPLPQANVDSLAASLAKLQGLDVPDTEPVDEPPVVDNTLPGDLPVE